MMLSDVAFSTPTNHLAKHDFEHIFYALKNELGAKEDLDIDADGLKELVKRLQGSHLRKDRQRVPAGCLRATQERN